MPGLSFKDPAWALPCVSRRNWARGPCVDRLSAASVVEAQDSQLGLVQWKAKDLNRRGSKIADDAGSHLQMFAALYFIQYSKSAPSSFFA